MCIHYTDIYAYFLFSVPKLTPLYKNKKQKKVRKIIWTKNNVITKRRCPFKHKQKNRKK